MRRLDRIDLYELLAGIQEFQSFGQRVRKNPFQPRVGCIAAPHPNNLWRRAKSIRQQNKITVFGHDNDVLALGGGEYRPDP
jgi:hypothetical protein